MLPLIPLLPSMGHTTRALVHAGFFDGDASRILTGTPPSTLPLLCRVRHSVSWIWLLRFDVTGLTVNC